jgi:hypothetical protein
MGQALAIARARERTERDASVERREIGAHAFFVVTPIARRVALATRTSPFGRRRWRRRPRATPGNDENEEEPEDYCVFGMHVASAPAAAKHVEPWMQSVSVWQG